MPRLTIYILAILMIILLPVSVKAEVECGLSSINLKVLSLNIHSAIDWNGHYDLEGLVSFIKQTNPDLVGLQEVDRCWSNQSQFQDIPAELALRLNMYSAFAISRERNNGYFGNLILSKYPIIQTWTNQLPGSLETRSYAFAQVDVDGVRINFLTTHLGLSVADRLKQTTKLIQFSNQLRGPLIIAGDFNGDSTDPGIANLKVNLIDLQDLSEFKAQGTFRLRDGSKPGPNMDYILTTPDIGLSKFQIIDNFVSDHLPVLAEVIINVSREQKIGEPVFYQQAFL